MSCPPPPEILDLIVDDLHDEPATLKSCCVVSKSWVPRARKYLFARVEFRPLESHIERWKKTFPDPSNSPAHHTRSLSICGIPVVTAADAGVDGWIRTFHNVEHLRLDRLGEEEHQTSLAPFYGLSPGVRSLSLISTSIEVFDLICSFPLLEDLALIGPNRAGADGWNTPSISPKFTGSLHLRSTWEINSITHRLCTLPGGLHFTKITLGLSVEDGDPIMDLISSCSDTLESLSITCFFLVGTSRTPYLDLSKATKLKDLELRWKRLSVEWITMALGTVKSEYLRGITIHPTTAATIEDSIYQEWQELDQLLVQFWTTHSMLADKSTVQWIITALQTVKSNYIQNIVINPDDNLLESVSEEIHQEWQDLDRLLVQLCITYSIRPRVMYNVRNEGKTVPGLLPELTRRGMVDPIETVIDAVAGALGGA